MPFLGGFTRPDTFISGFSQELQSSLIEKALILPDDTLPAGEISENIANDKQPKFQGGDFTDFRTWVMRQLLYPVEAMKNGIQGNVIAQFVIDTTGRITRIDILESPHKLLSAEVIRIIKSSPPWEPGEHDGKKIDVQYSIPVHFFMR